MKSAAKPDLDARAPSVFLSRIKIDRDIALLRGAYRRCRHGRLDLRERSATSDIEHQPETDACRERRIRLTIDDVGKIHPAEKLASQNRSARERNIEGKRERGTERERAGRKESVRSRRAIERHDAIVRAASRSLRLLHENMLCQKARIEPESTTGRERAAERTDGGGIETQGSRGRAELQASPWIEDVAEEVELRQIVVCARGKASRADAEREPPDAVPAATEEVSALERGAHPERVIFRRARSVDIGTHVDRAGGSIDRRQLPELVTGGRTDTPLRMQRAASQQQKKRPGKKSNGRAMHHMLNAKASTTECLRMTLYTCCHRRARPRVRREKTPFVILRESSTEGPRGLHRRIRVMVLHTGSICISGLHARVAFPWSKRYPIFSVTVVRFILAPFARGAQDA
jgi:hypothetical protein